MSKNQRPKSKVTDYQKFLNSYKISKEDGLTVIKLWLMELLVTLLFQSKM